MKDYTPGPWNVPVGFESIWSKENQCVATVNAGLHNAAANAKLISKAPELAEVLEGLLNCWDKDSYSTWTLKIATARRLLQEIEGKG